MKILTVQGLAIDPFAKQQVSPFLLYERAAPVLLGTFSIAALRTPPL